MTDAIEKNTPPESQRWKPRNEDSGVDNFSFANNIMTSLYDLRISPSFSQCDGIAVTDGGHEFPVHKAVLCACSGYFKALLCGPMSNQGQVPTKILMPNASAEAVHSIICFAYLGSMCLPSKVSKTFEILTLADRLMIPAAVEACERNLTAKLNRKNCLRIYLISTRFLCPRLRKRAKEYILKQPPHTWTRYKGFEDLALENLLELLRCDELNTREEEDVLRLLFKWISLCPASRSSYLPSLMSVVRLGLCSRRFISYMIEKNTYIRQNDILFEQFTTVAELLDYGVPAAAGTPFAKVSLWFRPRLPNGVIFAVGGWMRSGVSSRLEIYDPKDNNWLISKYEDHQNPRVYHGVVRIGRVIYCIGGFDGQRLLSTVRRFDMDARTWSFAAHMQKPRCYAAYTTCEPNLIFAGGGFDGFGRTNSCEIYDASSNSWSSTAPMQECRSDGSAAFCADAIYVAGGFNGLQVLDSVEKYLLRENMWTSVSSMGIKRSAFSLLRYKSWIIAVGGFDGKRRLKNVDCYDPGTNKWVTIAALQRERSSFIAVIIGQELYVAGGFSAGDCTECFAESLLLHDELPSPKRQNGHKFVAHLKGPRSAAAACVLEGPGLGQLLYDYDD